jgi:hypothetical protein
MAEYTPEEIEKAKQKFREIAEKGRTQGDIRKSYYDIPDKSKGGGGGGMGVVPKSGAKRTPEYKSGGTVSKRADGCAIRGKTKGKIVSMKKGGSC